MSGVESLMLRARVQVVEVGEDSFLTWQLALPSLAQKITPGARLLGAKSNLALAQEFNQTTQAFLRTANLGWNSSAV